MFGSWGIVIGPVLMIVIVTTISVYLAVYKGVPMDQPDERAEKPKRRNAVLVVGARRGKRSRKTKPRGRTRRGATAG